MTIKSAAVVMYEKIPHEHDDVSHINPRTLQCHMYKNRYIQDCINRPGVFINFRGEGI